MQLNDATFTKFLGLSEGDRFIDPQRRRLMALKEKKKANVTEAPFRAASPMKESTCPGDFYATFGGKVVYEGVSGPACNSSPTSSCGGVGLRIPTASALA